MWFGDLVTMNWWDGIWLNEAFASLMEVIASEATYPEFKLWNEMNQDRSRGFGVDSLKSSRPVEFEVKSPEEAEEMFDVLTYQKGSTVLRMFETFIGEESFKEGVRNYLNKYEYKNTHSSDLWNELTNSSSYNLSEILPTWIKQEGYPIVKIEKVKDSFKISQKKYLIDGDTDDSLWSVPLNIRCLDNGTIIKEVIVSKSQIIEIDGKVPFINNGGWSFFHSAYSEELFEMIIADFEKLDINEKYRILEDSWMALRTGELSLKLFLRLLNLYATEEEINTWSLISSIFSTFAKINNSEEFKNYVRDFSYPLIEKHGFDYSSDFNQEESQLKSLLCGTYAKITEDSNFINNFSDQFNSNAYENYVDGNYFNLVLYVAGMNEEISTDRYIEKLKNSTSPQIEARYRGVIGTLSDPNAPKKVIGAILNQSIRGADAPYIIATLLSNTKNASSAFLEIKNNWNSLLEVMPGWTSSRILDSLSSIYDESLSEEIKIFIKENPLPSAEKITKQKIERMDANIKFKNLIKEDLINTKFNL
jgi:puromycin-sensitive aminopeptidase